VLRKTQLLTWPLAAAHKEPKDSYPHEHMCEVVKDTSEGDSLWDTLNLGEELSDFDKCTFDVSVRASPTSTGSRSDEQPTCDGDEPPPFLGALAIFKSFMGYHYGDLLGSQLSFPVSNKLLSQHSLANSHVSMLEDLEEEITFYCSDSDSDDGDDEDTLMVIEPCAPFGTQLFPHHDGIFPQVPCDIVPALKEMMHHEQAYHGDFSDGEPLPVTTEEPYVEESAVGEPACFGGPKGTITSSAGFNLDTSSLN